MERTAVCALSRPYGENYRSSSDFPWIAASNGADLAGVGRGGHFRFPAATPAAFTERGTGSRGCHISPVPSVPLRARPAPLGTEPYPGRRCRLSLPSVRSLLLAAAVPARPDTDRCVWMLAERSDGCEGLGRAAGSVSPAGAGTARSPLTIAGVLRREEPDKRRATCATPGEWPEKRRWERQHLCPGICALHPGEVF